MQYKSIALLLLLGLVALVQGVAIAEPRYGRPGGYDQNRCRNQCHSALQPVSDDCDRAYSRSHKYARDGGMNLGQSVDIEGYLSSVTLGEFSEGCHKCFFEVAITCIFGYSQNAWSSEFFSTCIDTTVIACWNN